MRLTFKEELENFRTFFYSDNTKEACNLLDKPSPIKTNPVIERFGKEAQEALKMLSHMERLSESLTYQQQCVTIIQQLRRYVNSFISLSEASKVSWERASTYLIQLEQFTRKEAA